MIFNPASCPTCGQPPRGTVERLAGCAEFIMPEQGEEEGFEFEYSGYTDVWWDEQRTNVDKRGRVELICPDAHEWHAVSTETPAHAKGIEA